MFKDVKIPDSTKIIKYVCQGNKCRTRLMSSYALFLHNGKWLCSKCLDSNRVYTEEPYISLEIYMHFDTISMEKKAEFELKYKDMFRSREKLRELRRKRESEDKIDYMFSKWRSLIRWNEKFLRSVRMTYVK